MERAFGLLFGHVVPDPMPRASFCVTKDLAGSRTTRERSVCFWPPRTPIDRDSQIWEHVDVTILGEAAVARFARKYAASRKPLSRFLAIAKRADWPHFPAVWRSFPATDYAPATGTMIFDIGGNKYRLIARVDFEEQLLYIQDILTHEECHRENF